MTEGCEGIATSGKALLAMTEYGISLAMTVYSISLAMTEYSINLAMTVACASFRGAERRGNLK